MPASPLQLLPLVHLLALPTSGRRIFICKSSVLPSRASSSCAEFPVLFSFSAARLAPEPHGTSCQCSHHGFVLFVQRCRWRSISLTFLSYHCVALCCFTRWSPFLDFSPCFPPACPSIVRHSPAVSSICSFALPLIFPPNEPSIVRITISNFIAQIPILCVHADCQRRRSPPRQLFCTTRHCHLLPAAVTAAMDC